jgi:hypothetical protein
MTRQGRVPLFMTGSDCLPIRLDNRINSALFLGRVNHFTLQFMIPLARGDIRRTLRRSLALVGSLAPETGSAGGRFADFEQFGELVGIWYGLEMALLGHRPSAAWADEATRRLVVFAGNAFAQSRGANPPDGTAPLGNVGYLEWIDSSGSGGPSAELMCFMNTTWRRAGFIYGSPFDAITRLSPNQIEGPYSVVADLHKRGLYPPKSAE